jgi:hypothetical protein
MKSIIALIIALTAGGVGGWSLGNQAEPVTETSAKQAQDSAEAMPIAQDFVSLRPSLENLPTESLSAEERAGLLYMREEEKLARDVYSTLYDTWELRIFTNITQSEQTHTEAIRDLLVKYQIEDPVIDDTVGVFANPELQTLYNDLVAKGTVSVEEALTVGVLIEELDIRDLQAEIDTSDNEDIDLVYENLLRGSRNHLRSFMSQLTQRGGDYEPQYITATTFDQITQSAKETGSQSQTGGNQGNVGGGRGWGQNN